MPTGISRPIDEARRGSRRCLLRGAHLLAAWLAVSVAVPAGAGTRTRPPAAPAAGETALAADAVMKKVQQRYDQTASFTALFDQEARVESIGRVLRSRGRVWFEKPGRMRWEYEEPEPQTIVGDGSFLWVDQPRDKQVLRASLREAFQSQTPVSFLLGVGRLDRDFDGRLEPTAAGAPVVLLLVPKVAADSADVGSLSLEVDPVTWDIRAATVKDPLGNRTRLELREVERNVRIDPARFRYEPAPGVDVLVAPERPSAIPDGEK